MSYRYGNTASVWLGWKWEKQRHLDVEDLFACADRTAINPKKPLIAGISSSRLKTIQHLLGENMFHTPPASWKAGSNVISIR